jgi:stage II sporulation protein D
MRVWINVILFAIIVMLVIPTIIVSTFSKTDSEEVKSASPIEKEQEQPIRVEISGKDPVVTLYDHYSKKLVSMDLEEYVIGVVAAEMPASFEIEALKAQAVAARTLAAYKMRALGGKGCSRYEGADVCSEFSHCQAWIPENQMKKNWGGNYEDNVKKIKQAVFETWGEIMTYNGKPIEVFFHSTSNGKTENVEEVFSASLPYYGVVESPGEENAPKYSDTVSFTIDEFIRKFKSQYKGSNLTRDNIKNQINILSYTEGGRVKEIMVGGVKIKGTDFRNLYGLNSTDFKLRFEGDKIIIETRGYGHGVGMSQVGANHMAGQGNSYQEILHHYYQGIEINKIH